jgi:thiosulfate/3-mercaptopyruvate sulfurtransferase
MSMGTPRSIPRCESFVLVVLLLLVSTIPAISGSSASGGPDLGLLDVGELTANPAAWVILDARPRSVYKEGHLPGARSFSWEELTRTDANGVPFKILPPEELALVLGAKGIDEHAAVVVYGDADKSWGGEGWACWALAWVGHQGPIRLLNGGTQAWASQGLELQVGDEPAATQTRTYTARPRPELLAETTVLRADPGAFTILDVRSLTEWLGGHIPGAIRIPWDEFYQGPDRRPLPAEKVRELFRRHDVRLDRPVVYVCTGGIRSGYVWLIHELSGLPAASNYEGGMEEWKRTK